MASAATLLVACEFGNGLSIVVQAHGDAGQPPAMPSGEEESSAAIGAIADAGAAAPATDATASATASETTALYYGACLSELAFGQLSKVFNFYTLTKFTSDSSGETLSLTIQPLNVVNSAPPLTFGKSGLSGRVIPAPSTPIDTEGRFLLHLETVNVPGSANPISGSDVEIDNAKLQGRFTAAKFCARLGGNVIKPAAAARTLDIDANVCQFVPVKDGDQTPTFTIADFQPESCPL